MIAVKYDFIDSKTDRQAEELVLDERRFINAYGFDYQKFTDKPVKRRQTANRDGAD